MSDTHDQQPRSGATGKGTAGAAREDVAAMPGTAAPAGATRGYVPRPAPGYDDVGATYREPSGTVLGLTMFAATFMMLSGVLGFFEGLAAIIRGPFFTVLPTYAFSLSAVGRGWVQLILGVLVFFAGVALFADRTWARITGVVLAAFSLVANFVFLPYYPVWAIVVIAVDAFVIWALLAPRGHHA